MRHPFVPDGFVVPAPLITDDFRFEPLSPRHNDADHQAWSSSVQHIRRTPGFSGRGWPPDAMTWQQNRHDLERHENHFAERKGFTYAVFDQHDGDYLGCVYLYPSRTEDHDADVRSWVRSDQAQLDEPLHTAASDWLTRAWPWRNPEYAPRSPAAQSAGSPRWER